MTGTPHAPDWQEHAACAGAALDFVPASETDEGLDLACRQYCNTCPVRGMCLLWAMYHRVEGYWGGTSHYQRKQLLRVRTRSKCPLCKGQSLVILGDHELCLSCAASWVRDARCTPITAVPLPAGNTQA